jgi:hypothetical protein
VAFQESDDFGRGERKPLARFDQGRMMAQTNDME